MDENTPLVCSMYCSRQTSIKRLMHGDTGQREDRGLGRGHSPSRSSAVMCVLQWRPVLNQETHVLDPSLHPPGVSLNKTISPYMLQGPQHLWLIAAGVLWWIGVLSVQWSIEDPLKSVTTCLGYTVKNSTSWNLPQVCRAFVNLSLTLWR